MLTPLDIQKQDFGVKMRGYNADEVDDFLDLVGADYEKLYRENKELKDKVIMLSKSIEEYKSLETSLRNALLYAQNTAEDMKKNASEKAKNILQEAESKAGDVYRQVELEARDKSQELAHIKSEIEAYKTKMKSFCAGIVEMLDKIE